MPPEENPRALASVRTPALENEEVALAPKYAGPYAEKRVDDAAPLKMRSEVVALCPVAGCVHASYEERPLPDPHADAFAETVPSAPTCRHLVPEPPVLEITSAVVEAVVAVSIVVEAKGIESAVPAGAEKVMDGAAPMTMKEEHRMPDEHEAEEVATDW